MYIQLATLQESSPPPTSYPATTLGPRLGTLVPFACWLCAALVAHVVVAALPVVAVHARPNRLDGLGSVFDGKIPTSALEASVMQVEHTVAQSWFENTELMQEFCHVREDINNTLPIPAMQNAKKGDLVCQRRALRARQGGPLVVCAWAWARELHEMHAASADYVHGPLRREVSTCRGPRKRCVPGTGATLRPPRCAGPGREQPTAHLRRRVAKRSAGTDASSSAKRQKQDLSAPTDAGAEADNEDSGNEEYETPAERDACSQE